MLILYLESAFMFFEVENLYFSYYRSPMTVRGAKFSFDKNSKLLLLASNEMGKTTMLKVLSGFDDSYLGSIKLNGKELKEIDNSNKNFSLLLSNPVLFEHKSIKFNIDYLCDTIGKEKLSDKKLSQLIGEFKIDKNPKTKVSKLSLFEKQKLAICRSFIKNPSIIFLDDQFELLDDTNQNEMESIYSKLFSQDCALIMTMSDTTFKNHQDFLSGLKFDKVLYLCDAVLYIYNTIEKFKNSCEVLNVFDFVDGYNKINGFIFRYDDKYYFCEEDKREIELDKKFYSKLESQKLENKENEKAVLRFKGDIDLENIEEAEFNNKLASGELLLYSEIDGKKLF